MEYKWDELLITQDHGHRYTSTNRHHKQNPSFSSTLLDAIYRSIDESSSTTSTSAAKPAEEADLILYRSEAMRKKQLAKPRQDHFNSSSSEEESQISVQHLHRHALSSPPTNYTMQRRPKPIRTNICAAGPLQPHRCDQIYDGGLYHPNYATPNNNKPKSQGSTFVKTKSRALKIYGDLKKVKQPQSPGGRLASFLNSLFTTGNVKKPKINISSSEQESCNYSTCSSASSFSRSCLSKTPSSSRDKLNHNGSAGGKRSVRFYPVSVIVGEDCRPCGHKSLGENQEDGTGGILAVAGTRRHDELKLHVMNESRRVEEIARDLLKNYHKKNNGDSSEDEDDDGASCSSSDLFELDNLSSIGIEGYRQELPVYETTNLNTNRAIANGLFL